MKYVIHTYLVTVPQDTQIVTGIVLIVKFQPTILNILTR